MKSVNIMGVHQFLGRGVTKKNNICGELPKKGGLVNLQEERDFEGGSG